VLRGLVTALIIGIAIWLLAIVILFALGRRAHARELAVLVPNLVILFRGLLKDDRVPGGTKGLVWFALAWLASPIDLIPEFIPVLGPLDDALVAALVLRHVLRRTGRAVLVDHWRGEAGTLDVLAGRVGMVTGERSSTS
jgi:uncharacterized membrane protein YkvA (DUF1232 family)